MPNNQPRNAGKIWTAQDINDLKRLARENTPTRVAALKLERTPQAIYDKASDIGLTLKPTNQRPYNRRKD